MAQRVLRVLLEMMEPLVHKVLRVKLAHKVQRVHRDLKGIQEIRVQRDLMVRLELLVHKVLREI